MCQDRWGALAVEELGAFERAEFGALAEIVDRYRDTFCERVLGKARRKLHPDNKESRWPHPSVRPSYLGQIHDARLVANVLGERIGTPPVAVEDLPESATERVVLSMLEIESRAIIRGCFEAIENLMASQKVPA